MADESSDDKYDRGGGDSDDSRVQATVNPLDPPRVLPRPATSIQNGNMLKIRAILPTRVSPKSARRISWVQNARSSRRKGNQRRKRSQEKPLNVSPTEKAEKKTSFTLRL